MRLLYARGSKEEVGVELYDPKTNALRAYEFTTENQPDIDLGTCSVLISDFIRQLSLLKIEMSSL